MKILVWLNEKLLRHFGVALVTKPDIMSKKMIDSYLSTVHTKEWINENSESRDPGQKDTQKEARVKGEWAVTVHDTGDSEKQG